MGSLKSLQGDIAYGTAKEDGVIQHLQVHFKESIAKSVYQYSSYDAESENTKYEIKCRRIKHDTFKTTIIGCNKTRTKGRLVFVFCYTNGLYYIEYNKEKFDTYDIKQVGAIRSGGLYTVEPHFEIPIEHLTRIDI